MRNIRLSFLLFLTSFNLTACGGGGSAPVPSPVSIENNTELIEDEVNLEIDDAPAEEPVIGVDNFIISVDHEEASDYLWDIGDEVRIDFFGNSIGVVGAGVSVSNTIATINSAGTYRIVGPLSDGQVIVDTSGVVRLIFDGINISNSNGSPINIKNAEKTIIILENGSTNVVTDAMVYVFDDPLLEEPNAAIFSKDDLSFYAAGNGTLNVNGNFNDGIASKDGLVINSGDIIINAKDDGLRGKDYVVIKSGNLTINSGGDGVKSDHDNFEKGYIWIDEGVINVTTTGGDALQAESNIQIAGGKFTLVTGGGSSILAGDDSLKGLKAKVNLFIQSGVFSINASDDAIHSNNGISINGGTYTIATGDDGIHSDLALFMNDGDITISDSNEGLESSVMTINDGSYSIIASDDGINTAGGEDNLLTINGGYISIDADGDGIDSNGSIVMNSGTALVLGASSGPDSAFDYDDNFTISGGLLVGASNASVFARAPNLTSTQNSIDVTFIATQSANQINYVQSNSGVPLLTFTPTKDYRSFIFSSSDLSIGSNYQLYTGGSTTGVLNDGLYTGGVYTPGNLRFGFVLVNVVTEVE